MYTCINTDNLEFITPTLLNLYSETLFWVGVIENTGMYFSL